MALKLCILLLLQVLITEAATPSESHDGPFVTECAEDDEVLPVQLLQKGIVLESPSPTHVGPPAALLSVEVVTISNSNSKSFINLTLASAAGVVILWSAFCVLRLRYPLMYSNNAKEGFASRVLPDTLLGWLGPTALLGIDDVAESVTLDAAMFLEFSHLCMKILATVSIQIAATVGVSSWTFTKNTAVREYLTHPFDSSAKDGSFYWAQGIIVFGVVTIVTRCLHVAMKGFLPRRFKWLQEMSELHANTVLVESIPEEFLSEEGLKRFFEQLVPGAVVRSLSLCRETTELEVLVRHFVKAGYNLKVAEGRWAKAANSPECRPLVRHAVLGSKIEAIPFWKTQRTALLKHIKNERVLITQEQPFRSSGFVTFAERSSAEILLRLGGMMSIDTGHWQFDNAPEPGDVLWHDLTQDDTARGARTAIGYLMSAVLFFAYLPVVLAVVNVAKLINLDRFGLHALQAQWAGFAPALGLLLVVGVMPTLLALIFQLFFTVKSVARLQHTIQGWYFWFQLVFLVFGVAAGLWIWPLAGVLHKDTSFTRVLAETFPQAAHFFLSWLVLQWLSQSLDLTRCFPLMRFKSARAIFADEDAKLVAEPEDQDPWGIGSRSAVCATMMSIGLIFGTLCPLLNVLAFINFAICRVVYGYLVCFVETKKPDLGGAYWVTKLKHVFAACIIYAALMTIVLAHQAATYGPALLAAAGLGWALGSRAKFDKYRWERLPIQDIVLGKPCKKRPDRGQYVQPELLEPAA